MEEHIHVDIVYALLPVKTNCGKWVWFKRVERTIDESPLIYLGLLPKVTYELIN